MLILTHRVSEAIVIGDYIKITVTGVNGHQVRLGIEAPNEISVHREEIYNIIQEEKRTGQPSLKRQLKLKPNKTEAL